MNLMDLAQRIAEQEVSRIGERVMAKHTPGPWVAKSRAANSGAEWEITAGDYFVCAFGFTPSPGGNDPEAEANARLIAAAPELLECLKAAVTIIGHPDDSMTKHFNEVIAKAESKD